MKSTASTALDSVVQHCITFCDSQLKAEIVRLGADTNKYPSYTKWDGINQWQWVYTTVTPTNNGGWTPGFFPGCLWKMAQITSDTFWIHQAKRWSPAIAARMYNNGSDVASNAFSTFYPYYTITGDSTVKQILMDGAASILGTNNANVNELAGVLGYNRKADLDKLNHWQAFIDHMPNLEMVLWAAGQTSDSASRANLEDVAWSHANIIGKNTLDPVIYNSHPQQYREGSVQRNYFDYTDGAFLFGEAKQAWNHESTWSRGQAWLIYGFASAYEYFRDDTLLSYTKKATRYFITHLPEYLPGDRSVAGTLIPQWDFDFTSQRDSNGILLHADTEKDASAASMAIAGMFKLIAAMDSLDEDRHAYWILACNILKELCSPVYLAKNKNCPAIVMHSCYHHPECYAGGNTQDISVIWADYFLLHAMQAYLEMKDQFHSSAPAFFVDLYKPLSKNLVITGDTLLIASRVISLASDTIQKLTFLINDSLLMSSLSTNDTVFFNLHTEGQYVLRSFCVSKSGDTAWSLPVEINVYKPFPPKVTITSPLNLSEFTNPVSIPIMVSCTDTDGTIRFVDFYSDSLFISRDSVYPFEATYNNPLPGTRKLTVIAVDDDGIKGSSDTIRIIVNFPVNDDGIQAKSLQVYPNPFDDVIFIKNIGRMEIVFFDLAGKTLYQKVSGGDCLIPVASLPPGIYILKIKTENGKVEFRKMVK